MRRHGLKVLTGTWIADAVREALEARFLRVSPADATRASATRA